jgi:ATP-binding cassette subfamily C protein
MKLRTYINDSTSTISGGQKQRLLIARAILKDPKLILFDEATSALDNYTQKIVTNTLKRLNATRIVIAHRLSTVKECDRICVLDKGMIVEVGSYDELMDKKGFFYDLVERQIV